MLTSLGTGYSAAVPADKAVVIADRLHKADGSARPIIWCHSAGGDATEPIIGTNNTIALLRKLTAMGGLVASVDAGGGHWGNDSAQARIDEALTLLRSPKWGASASKTPLMLGVSMGGLLVLNYLRANLANVRGAVVFYPVVNLQWMHDNGATVGTENAYGGSLASFNAAVNAHNPIAHASDYTASGVPMKMWYSTADAVVGSVNQTDFATAVGSALETHSVGAASHADMTKIDTNEFVSFIEPLI